MYNCRYFRDVLLAIEYLHSWGLAHREYARLLCRHDRTSRTHALMRTLPRVMHARLRTPVQLDANRGRVPRAADNVQRAMCNM